MKTKKAVEVTGFNPSTGKVTVARRTNQADADMKAFLLMYAENCTDVVAVAQSIVDFDKRCKREAERFCGNGGKSANSLDSLKKGFDANFRELCMTVGRDASKLLKICNQF